MTYPTGMVTSLHREIERSINIDIESSSRDDDVTVITNLSSVEASYTVVQGRDTHTHTVQGNKAVMNFLKACEIAERAGEGKKVVER